VDGQVPKKKKKKKELVFLTVVDGAGGDMLCVVTKIVCMFFSVYDNE